MTFRIYDFVKSEVYGVDEVVRAVVEANYWAEKAREAGWNVAFDVQDGVDVTITINRTDFPVPNENEEAA